MQTSNRDAVTSIDRWRTGRLSRREVLRLLGGVSLGAAVSGLSVISTAAVAALGDDGHQTTQSQETTPPPLPTPQLGKRSDGTTVWRIQAGVMKMPEMFDAMAYLPQEITINEGDAIFWDFSGDQEEFHTVTFLSGAPLPPFVIPDPSAKKAASAGPPALIINPLAAYPGGGTTYAGSGLVNSGLSGQPGMHPFVLTFTKAGNYQYNCLVHQPMMKGMVTVQERGKALPYQQSDYDKMAADQLAKIWADGQALAAKYGTAVPTTRRDGTNLWDATIGGEQGNVTLMRFSPDKLEIKRGDTVRWTYRSMIEPHTITLTSGAQAPDDILTVPQANQPPKLVLNPKVLAPEGGKVYSGKGYFNSGFLGKAFNGPTTYELTFDTPGTYVFFCALHGSPTSGMRGTITVS